MTDTEKKIVEIREALEKATPGTWVYDDICDDIYADKTDVIVCNAVRPEDGPLIANAPEWLRFLLDELERLKREYAEERAAHNAHVTELCELEKENRKLREDIERIIEILKNGQRAHWQTFKIRQLLEVPLE